MALVVHILVMLGFYALYVRRLPRAVQPPVFPFHLDYWLRTILKVAVVRLYVPYLVAGLLCLYLLPAAPHQGFLLLLPHLLSMAADPRLRGLLPGSNSFNASR